MVDPWIKPQRIVNEVVSRARAEGFAPEMTHKSHLLDCYIYAQPIPEADLVAQVLIEAYESKAGLTCVMRHLIDVVREHPPVPTSATSYR